MELPRSEVEAVGFGGVGDVGDDGFILVGDGVSSISASSVGASMTVVAILNSHHLSIAIDGR